MSSLSGASLTTRQRSDLHAAVLEYLYAQGFEGAASAFASEAGVERSSKQEGALEKKWTSVVRLQRKNMELVKRTKELEEQLEEYSVQSSSLLQSSTGLVVPVTPCMLSRNQHSDRINTVVLHPMYRMFTTCSNDASIKVWEDHRDTVRTLVDHTDAVQDVAWNSRGDLLASCSADLTIKLWTLDDGCIKTLYGHDLTVSALAWLPDSDKLVSASRDGTIKLWDSSSGYCDATFQGHREWVRGVAVSPNAKLLASCSSDKSIGLWDLEKRELIDMLIGHEHVVESVCFSTPAFDQSFNTLLGVERKSEANANPQYLVSGSRDKTVRVWDLVNMACVMTLRGHNNWVSQVAMHSNGLLIVSASDDLTVRTWDVTQEACVHTLDLSQDESDLTCFHLAKSGSLMVTGDDSGSVKLWKMDSI